MLREDTDSSYTQYNTQHTENTTSNRSWRKLAGTSHNKQNTGRNDMKRKNAVGKWRISGMKIGKRLNLEKNPKIPTLSTVRTTLPALELEFEIGHDKPVLYQLSYRGDNSNRLFYALRKVFILFYK